MSLTISSPGVCPSNAKDGVFPNLARHDKDAATAAEVTTVAEQELRAAGIEVSCLAFLIERGEVPSSAFGSLHGWSFERAWYYWRAKGPGIPPDVAEKLHSEFGREVRVDGHCACPSPLEWFHGFAVGSYHVDTQRGLNALAAVIRSVYRPAQADLDTERAGTPAR